jgi:molybdopterin synthase sulfur carrier subunit
MSLTIQLFGQFIEMAGKNTLEVEGVPDTDALRRKLESMFHTLQGIPYLVAVDKDIVTGNTPLSPTEVIALMPPYSGG